VLLGPLVLLAVLLLRHRVVQLADVAAPWLHDDLLEQNPSLTVIYSSPGGKPFPR
jgi:hypothetical protein